MDYKSDDGEPDDSPIPKRKKRGGKVIKATGKKPTKRLDKVARGGASDKWIASAISHPGRETRRADKNGISVHEQSEKDSHSSNPSLRGAGNLGLRLSKMAKTKK